MRTLQWVGSVGVAAVVALSAACSTWDSMSRSERGTAVGAGGGAVAGAVVGGPVGAVVGGVGGGVVGHEAAKPDNTTTTRTESTTVARTTSDTAYVRSVQQALNDRGFSVGPVDGRWGPSTEEALRQFQRSNSLQATGQLDAQTVSALGV